MTTMLSGVRCVERAERRLLWAMTALVMLAGLLLPAPAAAAHAYVWRKNRPNDNWKNPDNWNCIAASTDDVPCNAPGDRGFPNASADEALFIDVYDRNQTVNLAGTARVGHIRFGDMPFAVRIQPLNGDPNAQIITDAAAAGNGVPTEIIIEGNGGFINLDVTHRFSVPIVNESPIVVKPAFRTVALFENDIGPFAFDFTVIATGINSAESGTVRFAHRTIYTGRTIVRSGILVLDSPDPGNETLVGPELVVGDRSFGDGNPFARVLVIKPNQISDSMRVTVHRDGQFEVTANDHVGDVIITTEGIQNDARVTGGAIFEIANLTLVNAALRVRDGSQLQISGSVTASGISVISAAGSDGSTVRIEPDRTVTVNTGDFGQKHLVMDAIGIRGILNAGLTKDGPGTLELRQTGADNTYLGPTTVKGGKLLLTGQAGRVAVPEGILAIDPGAEVEQQLSGSIRSSRIVIQRTGKLTTVAQGQVFPSVAVVDGGAWVVQGTPPLENNVLSVPDLQLIGGLVTVRDAILGLSVVRATSTATGPAVINTSGNAVVTAGAQAGLTLLTDDGPQQIDLRIDAPIADGFLGARGLTKQGAGVLQLTQANPLTGTTTIFDGALLVTGSQPASPVTLSGGVLGGTGIVGIVRAANGMGTGTGRIAPGLSPGRLVSGGLLSLAAGSTVAMELTGLTPGTGYDQLDVRGPVSLGGATLALAPAASFVPTATTQLALVLNDGADPVNGTFAGLPEGAEVTLRGRTFTLSYRGGDGNDVVLTAKADDPSDPTDPLPPDPADLTYFLSEGATGDFFDEDVLLANPTGTAAPVTLTFAKENGEQVVATRVVPAQAHLTVHVDQIPGLDATSASVRVRSDNRVPLVVERSVFWDGSYYAGHTGGAVDRPAPQWFFAEGSQGFFDTFVLVINPNPTPTEVTFTFLRESAPPVVRRVTVGATTRLTLSAGDVPEIRDQSFGIAVEATQPIMAERAMYFGRTARGLSGGTESAGVTAPSKNWFLAEGATGDFFTTFVLLSNPQTTEAHVTLTYLLDTGEAVTVPKTIAANGRLTTNIAAEGDARLRNAAVSTVVTSDVPIIAERSMYWLGAASPWGEGHNSFGVVEAGTRWGLAEGRTGGPLNYHTYILLANPQTTAATVQVTYLRETGAPIVQTYTVAPTSRFNIDTNAIAGLEAAAFGALIDVTNNVPIVVERSVYWDAHGFQFSGGTNATGIRLAPVTAVTIAANNGAQSFTPNPATAPAGQTVAWTNSTTSVHRLTADDGSFDTGDLAAGATSAPITVAAGAVNYHCTIHPSMTGTITGAVAAASASPCTGSSCP